jgi:hypothetical protein
MEILEFDVQEQEIFRIGPDYVASNSVQFLKCRFTFAGDWLNLRRYASFTTDLTTAVQVLLEGDECFVPSSLLATPTTLYIAAIGFDEAHNIQATTGYAHIEIHLGALANVGEPPPPDTGEERNYYTKVETDALISNLIAEVGSGIKIGTTPPEDASEGTMYFDLSNA